MSIKQSIWTLLILFFVSFSSYAEFITLNQNGNNYHLVTGCAGWSIGDTVQVGLSMDLGGKRFNDGKCISASTDAFGVSVTWKYGSKSHQGRMFGVNTNSCPDGEVFNPETGSCEPPAYCSRQSTIDAIEKARNSCESTGKQFSYTCSNETESWESECNGRDCSDVAGDTGTLKWNSSVWGESTPSSHICSPRGGGCVANVQRSNFCTNSDGFCYAQYTVTDKPCNAPPGTGFCSDSDCNNFKPKPDKPPTDPDNPDHKPDDPTGGDIEDPSVLPDSDNDVVVPDKPDGKPDVEDPDIKPETDKAVVDAVVGMNKDVNKALNDLHISINKNKADVQNEIRVLNASVVTNTQAVQKQQINDNEIYRKTKALIQQANADITTAVNRNTGAINSVGEDVGKIAGSMEGIAEDVAGISETLDGIANTDTSGAGIGGTCIQAGNCKGFYNSGYPQGLNGLVSGQLENLKNNTIDKFVNSFGKMDLSNAKRPSFVLPVPFFGDFSFEAYINFDWIFGFVRACLIMTSIFAARRIIFGG
jgi:hypothetical protein